MKQNHGADVLGNTEPGRTCSVCTSGAPGGEDERVAGAGVGPTVGQDRSLRGSDLGPLKMHLPLHAVTQSPVLTGL